MKPRTDVDTAQTIENGLVIDDIDCSLSAWNYLVQHGVPTPIILRVLSSSLRRRSTDPAHADSYLR